MGCDGWYIQDVGAKSKDFNNLSGKYTMELIVGDAVIENPITWLMVCGRLFSPVSCHLHSTNAVSCILYAVFSGYSQLWVDTA